MRGAGCTRAWIGGGGCSDHAWSGVHKSVDGGGAVAIMRGAGCTRVWRGGGCSDHQTNAFLDFTGRSTAKAGH